VFGFFIRAANGQNSPQLRYENTHVALTCLPDSIGEYTLSDMIGTVPRFSRLVGANFVSLRLRTKNPNTLLLQDNKMSGT
jgi:hypothetical protein